MEKPLVFFLSPGRSSTQWIAARLRASYRDLAVVTHEPVAYEYRPKSTLRTRNFSTVIGESETVRLHLERIEACSKSGKSYIEVGWPVFSWIPYFLERYGSRLRLIHLTRHPVPFAYSLQSHGFYNVEARADNYVRHAQLDPDDPGVLHKEYRERWSRLTSFEKCLFQWIEVNEYARELQRDFPSVPFLHVRMEDVTRAESSWRALTDFLGLPPDPALSDPHRKRQVDKFIRRIDKITNPKKIHEHPAAVRLASEFGYDVDDTDLRSVRRRYQRPFAERLARLRKRVWRRLRRVVPLLQRVPTDDPTDSRPSPSPPAGS